MKKKVIEILLNSPFEYSESSSNADDDCERWHSVDISVLTRVYLIAKIF